jgi:hypothetical protein
MEIYGVRHVPSSESFQDIWWFCSGGAETGGTLRPLCSFTVPSFEDRSYRITSLTFSPEGEDVLVSYSSDHLYLFSVKVRTSYVGKQLKCYVEFKKSQTDIIYWWST